MGVAASEVPAGARDIWAVSTLLRYFTPKTGRWSTPTGEAWQPALAIEAVLNTYQRTRDVSYLNVIEKSFGRYRGRRSRFYDDDGWYLNAWLRAYDVTGDPKYLDEARALFTVMAGAWDDACGGGLWWSVERTYKNAITNELFLLAAARLHRRTGEPDYRRWADRAWAWFDASHMINSANLVNDGLNGDCVNNGDTTWTYNQGVILSALVELWRITGEREYLDRGNAIAQATIETLVHPDGVLREPSEPQLGNKDAHVFKGVFAQGLALLYDADRVGRPAFGAFLAANADAVWDTGRDARRGVGMAWRGPADRVTAATHASGCLLLGQVALLEEGTDTGAVRRPAGTHYPVEEAALVGLGLEATHAGYGGEGYAAHWHADGQRVTFTVRVESARPYTLTFRYAAGAGDAYRHLAVDGLPSAEKLLFTATPGWGSYSTVSYDVALEPGAHAVSLAYDAAHGSRNFLNLDCLVVSEGAVRACFIKDRRGESFETGPRG